MTWALESVHPGWLGGVALTWEGGDGEGGSGTRWVPSCLLLFVDRSCLLRAEVSEGSSAHLP